MICVSVVSDDRLISSMVSLSPSVESSVVRALVDDGSVKHQAWYSLTNREEHSIVNKQSEIHYFVKKFFRFVIRTSNFISITFSSLFNLKIDWE